MNLTKEQHAAIQCPDPVVLVSACPGSGKTRTLVEKVYSWVCVSTDPVTCITFTRKATAEMRQRLQGRVESPVTIDTFHGLCLGIVRSCAEALGWRHGVNPIDENEAKQVWNECCLYLDVKSGFSWDNYGRYLAGRWEPRDERVLKRIEAEYHRRLRDSNYMDFETIILKATEAIHRGLYTISGLLCVDEAQDTDARQYQFLKYVLQAGHIKQLFIVGDVNQCIPAGQMVMVSAAKSLPIESIMPGDYVLAAKAGKARAELVLNKTMTAKEAALEFTIEHDGRTSTFQATKEHVCFAAIDSPGGSYVYLMYRKDMGYRIGVSRTVGHNGHHFVVRTQQEHAERLWILNWHPDYSSAAKEEARLSLQFKVPKEPFVSRAGMWADQPSLNELFYEFGGNGVDILTEYELDFHRPNYIGKCKNGMRVAVNLFVGGKSHEVSVETSAVDASTAAELGMSAGRRGTFRLRKYFSSLREAGACAESVASRLGAYVARSLSTTTENRRMREIRAANLHIGMLVPYVKDDLTLGTAKVVGRREVPATNCYDLEVENAGTFTVNGVMVHNSIYAWRGARPELFNALDAYLEKPVTHFRLSMNFRSGPEICRVADLFAGEPMESASTDYISHPVGFMNYNDDIQEAADIPDYCNLQNGETLGILYRNHSIGVKIAESLKAAGIPFQRVGETGEDFWKRPDVADAVAYMRMMENPYSEQDFRRWFTYRTCEHGAEFVIGHAREHGFTPYQSLVKLSMNGITHTIPDDLNEIVNSFPDTRAFLDWYAMRQIEPEADTHEAPITLSTVHAAKGREWDHVIIAGVDATVWPGRGNYDEERRLLYVAITRARKSVLITFAEQRDRGFGTRKTGPSQFIEMINELLGEPLTSEVRVL